MGADCERHALGEYRAVAPFSFKLPAWGLIRPTCSISSYFSGIRGVEWFGHAWIYLQFCPGGR